MAEIHRVTTAAMTRDFVELPYRLYRHNAYWVPPLRRDEYRRLTADHNPFLDHAELEMWLAVSGRRVVGRIAGIHDQLHDEKHRDQLAWFGFFEAEDAPTAHQLLGAVEDWARTIGARAVRGPVNPSLNDSAGLLVEGFDSEPCALMPYNPAEYAAFVTAAGYAKVKDLWAWSLDLATPLPDRVTRVAERAGRRHGVVVRAVDLKAFDRDLQILQDLYRAAWDDNWGFVPPTDAEIRQLAIDLKPVIDPELVLFAEIDGRAVGCSVAIPDINQVLRRMNGRLFPFGIVHFLRRRSLIDGARLLLLGLRPEVRRLGLYPLLITEGYRRAVARGYRRGEMSWTLEDNTLVNAGIEAAGGRRYKTYRLYEKPVG